ncbi:MAG: gfo/Idh/MocA family oxidoreductase [Candidatus Omnitrophota bacterium]|jgi:predicted dehydrogenase|nr:MAG: gfo/Idh/MocA family oxidoreductase [Candidatus Omnitrophota bacterium]
MKSKTTRRQFLKNHSRLIVSGSLLTSRPSLRGYALENSPKRIKIGVIGCGSVSHSYLPHLAKSPFAELVSACDIIPERAAAQARNFNIPNQYPHIDRMLAGAPFDLLVNLTDMQEHEHLNKQAIEAGKHVWSEKPMANSLAAGQTLIDLARKKGVRLWGAPAMVVSPQFDFMARTLAAGKLGRVAAAHADYGHTGPDWSSFFYEKGGGSLPDLAVYNLTTLTGLLGPARSVVAMTSIVTPTRTIRGKGEVNVETEDNAMALMDHGNGVISHVQSGFNYFNPHGHDGSEEKRHTISIVGTQGFMGLVGYDWDPQGVDLATENQPTLTRYATDKGDFVWQMGASLAAECLATGQDIPITPEHALHVLEIIQAIHESQKTGLRIPLQSTFVL